MNWIEIIGKSVCIGIILCISSLAPAQSLTFSGHVVTLDNEPIPYAHVALQNKRVGTISDIDGYFELTVSESELANQSIVISSIGFQSVALNTTDFWNMVIKLEPLINELEEVVVTAERLKLSAENLVNTAIKKASKIDKDFTIPLNIEQRQFHKGILTKFYINNDAEVSRKNTIDYSKVIPAGIIEYNMDITSLQPSSFILRPEKILTNDLYTKSKLSNSKGKYHFQFTDTKVIRGVETHEVTLSQHKDLNLRNHTLRNDYKFYFSTNDLKLLRYERNEQTKFGEGYNEIHTIEHTVCDYDHTLDGDPILGIESEFEQYVSYLDRDGKVIWVENKREQTSGHRRIPFSLQDTSQVVQKYSSAKNALESNTLENKLYLFVFWKEYSDMIDTFHEKLYELIRTFTFPELEVLCITTSENGESYWKDISSSYALFNHYSIKGANELRPIDNKNVFLYKGGELLSSSTTISDKIMKDIELNVNPSNK